ncbi:MAG: hypothetical protein AAF928_09425 [Myxococcota bacterium]
MTVFVSLPELPSCSPEVYASALHDVIAQLVDEVATPAVGPRALLNRLPRVQTPEAGGLFETQPPHSAEDAEAGKYFSAVVETCYLVAAADDMAEVERAAVTQLVRCATGGGLDDPEAVFAAYRSLLEAEGLEARLDAVAEKLDFMAREEAMSFAATIAIADRKLARVEGVVLMALAKRFDYSPGMVQASVAQVAQRLAAAIEARQ